MIIGEDVRIDPLAVIKIPELIKIGSHVSIGCFTYISTKVTLGNWVHISPFVSIIGGTYSELSMGDYTAIGAGGRIICGSDDWTNSMICSFMPIKYRNIIAKPIIMEDLTGVATNSIVLPGVNMAKGSILTANSLLDKDTKEWGIYVGSPARLMGYRKKDKILDSAKRFRDEQG